MKSVHTAIAVVAILSAAGSASAATIVGAAVSSPTSLGSFAAGRYRISATGLIDLAGPVGGGFTLRPDGVPDTVVTFPGYGYFNPGGATTDTLNGGTPGVAGAAFNLGSLVGSFIANPGSGDYFGIGFGTVVSLVAPTTLYALVNDTYYVNNGGSFTVDVTAVPEPASWVMLIAGFGLVGAVQRRRVARLA